MRGKILFRADAGQSIGYGHFIRTLALADMLKDDFDCVFYTQTPSEYQVGELNKVCAYVPLPADNSRFQIFLDALSGDEIVVLDNYFYTTDYQRRIKEKGCKLVCIDDMHDKHYVADVVVNYGLVDRCDFSVEKYTKLCLGDEYLLLRKAFLNYSEGVARKKQILVNFGGSDPCHLTNKITKYLLSIGTDYRIMVILGKDGFLENEIRSRVQVLSNIDAISLARIMRESELGIFSASTISYEGRSQHLPMILGYYVDNQKEYFEKSIKMKGFVPLYDLRKVTKEELEDSLKTILEIQPEDVDYSMIPYKYIQLFKNL